MPQLMLDHQIDDLLESLWNLEDVHRQLVQKIQRLVSCLEDAPNVYP